MHRPLILAAFWVTAAGALAANPAHATTQTLDDSETLQEVIVSSRRQPGSVIGDIEPELQLSARDIRNLGVSNVSELIAALGSQLGSGRAGAGGRPIVLLNGVRIASFREIRDLPSEAILRSDILPEEVALKYGYPPTQRVLNIVLRPRFRAVGVEAELGERSEGGRRGKELEASWLRIREPSRIQIEAQWSDSAALIEENDPTRSLLPDVRSRSVNAVYGRPLVEGWSGTISASLDERDSFRLLGLSANEIIGRESELRQTRGSAQLQGAWRGWRITATLNAERDQLENDTFAGSRVSAQSESINRLLDADVLLSGSLGDLPGGSASVNVRVGSGERRIGASNSQTTNAADTELLRQRHDMRASLDLPLWSKISDEGSRRTVSLNLNGALEDLSDFGQLQTAGLGLNARLSDSWRLLFSVTEEDGAPGMAELGAPEVRTPAVRSFDFLRNETVFVTRIEGGNLDLLASNTRTRKIGLNGKPFKDWDLDLGVEYLAIDNQRLVGDLSLATAATSLAFGDRFERDLDGRLIAIDTRALNLGDRERQEWRWTLNLRRPWGPQVEPPMRGPRSGGGAGGRPDPARFRAFARQGSWQLALTHTLRERDVMALAGAGGIRLDLLTGDALFNDRGTSRQEFELRLNGARNGYGGRVNARWQEGTRVTSGGSGGNGNVAASSLRFADLTTVDLRLFADLGLQPIANGRDWLRGARVALSIDNVFDRRQSVTDTEGRTPANYRPELLDPLGRYVELSFRKLFVPTIRPATRDRSAGGESS